MAGNHQAAEHDQQQRAIDRQPVQGAKPGAAIADRTLSCRHCRAGWHALHMVCRGKQQDLTYMDIMHGQWLRGRIAHSAAARRQHETQQLAMIAALFKGELHDFFHVLRFRARFQPNPDQPVGHHRQGRGPRRREEDRAGRAAPGPPVPGHVPVHAPGPGRGRLRQGRGARLAGVEVPSYEDTEQSFAELQAAHRQDAGLHRERCRRTASKRRPSATSPPAAARRPSSSRARSYLVHYALPHFYFHATTAYEILRHNGVEVGKKDFIGSF